MVIMFSYILYILIYVDIFDSFGVEHIPEEIKNFIGNKNIFNKYLK